MHTSPTFQYDPEKSAANREKHGINFEQVQALWGDPNLLEIPARSRDEPRRLVIGRLWNKVWAVVVTPRGADIRLISARRLRLSEVALYESQRL